MKFGNWRFWLGVAVSAAFLVVLVLRVDRQEVSNALAQANYLLVVPAILVYFGAVYFRSLRWAYLLSPVGEFPVKRLYPVVIIGYMANNLLPVRLGELVRSYYLAHRESMSGSTALATIAVERVYDGITLLAFAALSAPLLMALGLFGGEGVLFQSTVWLFAVGIVLVFLAGLGFLTLLSWSGSRGLVLKSLSLAPGRFQALLTQLVLGFIHGLHVLNSPRKHGAVFLLSLPVWLLEAAMYLMIAYSFGIHLLFDSFWALVLVMLLLTATSNLATAVPSTVGGIGPFEVAAQQTLLAFGVGASVGAIYAGFLHLVALWLPVNLLGLIILWKENLSLRTLTNQSLVASSSMSNPTADPTPQPSNQAPR